MEYYLAIDKNEVLMCVQYGVLMVTFYSKKILWKKHGLSDPSPQNSPNRPICWVRSRLVAIEDWKVWRMIAEGYAIMDMC